MKIMKKQTSVLKISKYFLLLTILVLAIKDFEDSGYIKPHNSPQQIQKSFIFVSADEDEDDDDDEEDEEPARPKKKEIEAGFGSILMRLIFI